MKPVIIIGAGVGGLTTAAVLARAGLDVTVLEAHVYPGGCAGTFYHQGYRFDAGATLAAGFYPGGPMDMVAKATGIASWPIETPDTAMLVHLPDGQQVSRFTDERRWAEQKRVFGAESDAFFRWQEDTAGALWSLALRLPPWPPHGLSQALSLLKHGMGWILKDAPPLKLPGLLADAFRPVAHHLRGASQSLRQFIDAQLLISAQATSQHVYALYGAAALDLPRRGVAHLHGGMGAVSDLLVQAVRQHGGQVRFRQEVTRLEQLASGDWQVHTRRGDVYSAAVVIANLPQDNISRLLGKPTSQEPPAPARGWGAFMVYIGLDGAGLSPDAPLHHQVLQTAPAAKEAPPAEGNTLFMSLSLPKDASRAPSGHRALTISTHTDLRPWWQLYNHDSPAYEQRRQDYLEHILTGAERVIPDLRQRAALILPGTPVTFERFTRRRWGWVGGYPQTRLYAARQPRLARNLWMVGDSVFPGQSMPAVALGGLRIARAVLSDLPGTAAVSLPGVLKTPPPTGMD
jgi:C-3',4' desaturase CrtD